MTPGEAVIAGWALLALVVLVVVALHRRGP